MGIIDQRSSAKISLTTGPIRKGVVLDKVGLAASLVKSFNASARGCGMPAKETLFGPLRD